TVHADFAVLASGGESTITKSNAGDRSRMASESALALSSSGIPDLYHPILRSSDNPERISTQGPNSLQMAEERAQAPTCGGLPQPNRRVQRAGNHVARWCWTTIVEGRSKGR